MQVLITGRKDQTIQTHNAVVVPLSGQSAEAVWHDADGFDKLAVTSTSEASHSCSIQIWWSNDQVNPHYYEQIVSAVSSSTRGAIADIKARYFKITLLNNDGASAHTMNAWAYLKA